MNGPFLSRVLGISLASLLALLPLKPARSSSPWKSKVPRDFASAILMEAETGQVLYEVNPHLERSPASTTKVMTALIVMEAIEEGRVSLADSVRISRRAMKMGGTQVYLEAGEVFLLEDLMKAVLIASGNDAAVAVAEHVGGTYEQFAHLMNQKARELGLKETTFHNPHGLDDVPSRRNITSARDLAKIARALIRYPQVLQWTSTRSAPFRNGQFMLNNTNRLLGRIQSMDGLKTGFTSRAGFCLVATGERHGMRLISVILGSRTSNGRFRSARHLLETGFTKFQLVRRYVAGEPLGLEVSIAGGKAEKLPLVAGRNLSVVVQREDLPKLQQKTQTVGLVAAPVQKGAPLGFCELTMGGRVLARIPAVAARTVSKASFIDRLWQGLGFGRYDSQGTLR
jgi:D-alanyl-D-alanine carboxypeptidase (penicillin-binding protein 5/6)